MGTGYARNFEIAMQSFFYCNDYIMLDYIEYMSERIIKNKAGIGF